MTFLLSSMSKIPQNAPFGNNLPLAGPPDVAAVSDHMTPLCVEAEYLADT